MAFLHVILIRIKLQDGFIVDQIRLITEGKALAQIYRRIQKLLVAVFIICT